MCEFCTTHGDGKVWYRNAANYAHDLLSDLRRRQYIEQFLTSAFQEGFQNLGRLEAIYRKKGRLPRAVETALVAKAKEEHFGQVLPIEEIGEVVRKARTVVRMPCACRWESEHREERCCYAVSYGPEAWYEQIDMSYFGSAPDAGLEPVAAETAVRQMEDMEQAGAVHTIWTMMTPFIGAVCNCSVDGCLAMRTLTRVNVETMARAEYQAVIAEDRCTGCGLCDAACHFGAVMAVGKGASAVSRVDAQRCFGCGLCRRVCAADAIRLVPRRQVGSGIRLD